MRIYSIDFFKIIFTFLVVFAHMDINYPGSQVAVDFFFVFSGYFMARKFYSKSYLKAEDGYDEFSYTKDRIKTLYPQYLFSLIVLFCYMFAKEVFRMAPGSEMAGSVGDLVARVYELVPNALMLQDIGFFASGINAAAWYVSVMVIAGYFIYALMCRDEKLYTGIVFPLIFMGIYTFNGLYGQEPFGVFGPFYMPMLRGVGAMLEGVIIYRFVCSSWYTKLKSNAVIFNLIGLGSLAALFACQRYNNQQIIMFLFAISYLSAPETWLNKIIKGKIFARSGDWAYAVYLNHAVVIMIMEDLFAKLGIIMPREQFAWFAAAASAVYSVATVMLLDKIKAALKSKNIL